MKTAIYIEDGTVQLVITPESEFEKNALRSFENKPMEVKIFNGHFHECRGGWIRQYGDKSSLILRISEPKPDPAPAAIQA
jgi:hypothetical protein